MTNEEFARLEDTARKTGFDEIPREWMKDMIAPKFLGFDLASGPARIEIIARNGEGKIDVDESTKNFIKNSQGEKEMNLADELRVTSLRSEIRLLEKLQTFEKDKNNAQADLEDAEIRIQEVKDEIKEGKKLRAAIK